MGNIRDKCCIVGIGETEFSMNSGRSELTLALEAIKAALDDSGLEAEDIDGVVKYTYDSNGEDLLIKNLGIPLLRYHGEIGHGGIAACGAVSHACSAIYAGLAKNVLVFRALNERSGRRFGRGDHRLDARDGIYYAKGEKSMAGAFSGPYGLLVPGQMWALATLRHMHEYGTTKEQLGAVCITQRNYAIRNFKARFFRRGLTMSEYLEGKMIAYPLCIYDFCLESDGACAVVITSSESAKDLRQPPIYVMAASQAFPMFYELALGLYQTVLTDTPAKYNSRELFQAAGISPDDVNVAELYDAFSTHVLLQLEDFGFCKKGDGGPFVAQGSTAEDGQIPTNTHGGNLSEAYIHGMTHIIEAVRQLRGTACVQIKDAEIALVSCAGFSSLILRR